MVSTYRNLSALSPITQFIKKSSFSSILLFFSVLVEENIIGEIQRISNDSISPLQRLESGFTGCMIIRRATRGKHSKAEKR
jgi:hypothetical protein